MAHQVAHQPDRASKDRVSALAAMYGSERTDLAGLLAQSFALTSLGVAYMGIAAGFLGGKNTILGGELLPLVLAFPAWTVGAYHVLIVANVFAHNTSVEILERQLVTVAGLSSQSESLGARAGDKVTNIATQPAILKPQTIISYGGIYLLIVSFTGYCIASANRIAPDAWTTEVVTFAALYAVFAILSIGAWIHVLRMNKTKLQ